MLALKRAEYRIFTCFAILIWTKYRFLHLNSYFDIQDSTKYRSFAFFDNQIGTKYRFYI